MAQIIKDPAPIRKAIKDKGLTEEKAAHAIGLTGPQLSLSFSGKREFSLHELARLATLLKTDWRDWLPVFQVPTTAPLNLIKAVRSQTGLSQEEFASVILVGQSTVSRWEEDDGAVDLKTIRLLVSAYPNIDVLGFV